MIDLGFVVSAFVPFVLIWILLKTFTSIMESGHWVRSYPTFIIIFHAFENEKFIFFPEITYEKR